MFSILATAQTWGLGILKLLKPRAEGAEIEAAEGRHQTILLPSGSFLTILAILCGGAAPAVYMFVWCLSNAESGNSSYLK